MIHRQHRFHGHGSLRYVYSHGTTVRGPLCALKFVRNPKRDSYRLAIVVSKKVHKSAVVRNRIRRRLYEAFRREDAIQAQNVDMVVTVFSDQLAHISHDEIKKVVHAQLLQAGILQKKPPKDPTDKNEAK